MLMFLHDFRPRVRSTCHEKAVTRLIFLSLRSRTINFILTGMLRVSQDSNLHTDIQEISYRQEESVRTVCDKSMSVSSFADALDIWTL
jgi:hypothetical protein